MTLHETESIQTKHAVPAIDVASADVPLRATRSVTGRNEDSAPSSFFLGYNSDAIHLTPLQSEKLVRVGLGLAGIDRHYQLFLWLNGEFQEFLPHDVMVAVWGDFSGSPLSFDIVSKLSGVRTGALTQGPIDHFAREIYMRWVTGGRRPLAITRSEVRCALPRDDSRIHRALNEMQAIVVHGVCDARTRYESIYIAHCREPFEDEHFKARYVGLLSLLIAQIDVAFRRVEPLRTAVRSVRALTNDDGLNLSAREQEILDLIARGETNGYIASLLHISPFTVKNHLQRIFRKIGVNNRTQAATKYNHALHELRRSLI